MIYIYAFLFAGFACMIAQIILDNTKLTPGHITSIYASLGAILSFTGIYDQLIKYCGAGATVIISNFGHVLYTGGINGYYEEGILGIFHGILCGGSVAIVGAIVFSFICMLFFKPQD